MVRNTEKKLSKEEEKEDDHDEQRDEVYHNMLMKSFITKAKRYVFCNLSLFIQIFFFFSVSNAKYLISLVYLGLQISNNSQYIWRFGKLKKNKSKKYDKI